MRRKLGTVQFHHRANDKAYNLAVIERFAVEAASAAVKILAFPKMCVTGNWHVRNLGRQELGTLAEPVPDGASSMKTMALARELDMAIGMAGSNAPPTAGCSTPASSANQTGRSKSSTDAGWPRAAAAMRDAASAVERTSIEDPAVDRWN